MNFAEVLAMYHKQSSNHRGSLKKVDLCGCFYCLQTFKFDKIEEWTDNGETALCPLCGIDSVLPHSNQKVLKSLNGYYFSKRRKG